ncbi:uncharacterized protein TRAVEDRAFT_124332 [Trametes versicolor FP-101664 SS1]|uniref:uncharacterized protein n=1 Tax=Trametes versicolor (strain FP-101664) TaxID=717944 RepID=UPI00046221BE|nr:uncharacterized protein TRAVEDRAFT_124332 [Trametes versicolor FP-101664 SS1]EIW58926.1 hypothetical protein TRAVEDRAFT_124332 [Trametes versicolor FP-101664 SS1]
MDITQAIVLRAESLSTSLELVDFLEKICLIVGVPWETAKLAYKWQTDPAQAAPHALATDADVQSLFEENACHKRTWCAGTRPVKVIVVNLNAASRTQAALKAAEKWRKLDEAVAEVARNSEESCATEFEICRQKLRCPHCQEGNGFCWVDPKDPLALHELQSWARFMKDGKADRDCLLPPNSPLFDRLRASPSEREHGKKNTMSPSIVIHNHLASPLSDASSLTRLCPPSTFTSGATTYDYDDGDPIPITKILEALDQAMPEAKFSSFEGALKKEGFFYAENVLDYKNDTDYFVSKVSIPAGLVHSFVRRVEREVGTHKRCRLNDGTAQHIGGENVNTSAT